MGPVGLHQYLDRVEELLEAQQLKEAYAHCHHILEQLPRHIDTLRLMGRISLEQHEQDRAIQIFGDVLQADPEDLIAHAGCGLAWKTKGDFNKAIWHMERAAEVDINNRIVQSVLAILYKQVSDFKPAGEDFTAAALARLHFARGQYDQVQEVLDPVLDRNQERHDLLVLYAETLFRLNLKKGSAKLSSEIIKKFPSSIKANAILGLIYIQLEKPASAQRFATKLIPLLRPVRVTLDPKSLAGELFTSPLIAAVPERIMVDELELSTAIADQKEGDKGNKPTDLRSIATAGVPGWLTSPVDKRSEEGDDKKTRNEEIDDIEDIFLWLQAIADEEGSLIQLDSDMTVEPRKPSGESGRDLEEPNSSPFDIRGVDDPFESNFMMDIEGDMIDEDIQGLPPFEDLFETDTPLTNNDNDLPTWLSQVAGFTDRLELRSSHRSAESIAESKPMLRTAVAGGLMASFYATSHHSQTADVSEEKKMSEKNEHEHEPTDDSAQQFTDDQWLEELSKKTKDEINGTRGSSEESIDDLGEIEPGQEIPEWLAADLKTVDSGDPQDQASSSDFPLDETILTSTPVLEEDSEIPSWLVTEVASRPEVERAGADQLEPEYDQMGVDSLAEDDVYGSVSADIANLASEIPEDPDEAVAWLEQLAALEDTEEPEIPITILDEMEDDSEEILVVEVPSSTSEEELQYSLPADDQEAAEWLEEVVAISFSKALLDKKRVAEVVEEDITPQAYFDVAEEQAEAERIIEGEEKGELSGEGVEEQLPGEVKMPEDDEEVLLDWLDDLEETDESEAVIGGPNKGDLIVGEPEILTRDNELDWLDTFVDQDPEEIAQEPIELTEDDLDVPATVVVGISEMIDWEAEEKSADGLVMEEASQEEIASARTDSFAEVHESLADGDIESALVQYRESLKSGENLPDLVAELESVVDIYDDQPTLKRLLGDAYAENGQLQKALEMYRKALEDI